MSIFMTIDQNTLYLGISLLVLTTLNIILGGVNSLFQKEFDITKLFKGIAKSLVVVLCFVSVVLVGQLLPNILLINIDGKEVNLASATYLLMVSGYLFYGKEVLVKLSGFIRGSFKIDETNK